MEKTIKLAGEYANKDQFFEVYEELEALLEVLQGASNALTSSDNYLDVRDDLDYHIKQIKDAMK